jgi:hypothetical protein
MATSHADVSDQLYRRRRFADVAYEGEVSSKFAELIDQ